MSRRTDRVGDTVRAELAEILLREVSDPRVSLASVTRVSVSPDLRKARVGISVLGSDDEAREETLGILRGAAGFIRGRLGRRLTTKVTPELEFVLDQGAEYSQQISDLLEKLDEEDGPAD